jgi:hypothetical protein
MRFIVNNKGQYYHIIEELKCPFNEKKDYIILKDDEIIYWQNANNYYHDMKLEIEMTKEHIIKIELTKYRSETRKEKTLNYLRETLNKMISYERELKIDKVLKDDNEYKYWLC